MNRHIYIYVNVLICIVTIKTNFAQNFSFRYGMQYLKTSISEKRTFRVRDNYNNSYNFDIAFQYHLNDYLYFSSGLSNNVIKTTYFNVANFELPLNVNVEFGKKFKGDFGVGLAYVYSYVSKDKVGSITGFKDLVNHHRLAMRYKAGVKYEVKNKHYVGLNIVLGHGVTPLYTIEEVTINPDGSLTVTGEAKFKARYTGIGLYYQMPLNFKKKKE